MTAPLSALPFKDVKQRAALASLDGQYCHEYRADLDTSNKLASGDISAPQVATLLRRSSPADHLMRPHPADSSVQLHLISVDGWRIEFYFVDTETVYTRVHKPDYHA